MPKRDDIDSILIIGAGPIIIGQACEFDYSGTQAALALKGLGYRTILLNSNPATIMTDPMMAVRTYIEPINCEIIEKIIQRERPDAILPTMGGQTALNVTMELHRKGVLQSYNIDMLGARADAIECAENRDSFRKAMQQIGLKVPLALIVHNLEQAMQAIKEIKLPAILRPSYTLAGYGGAVVENIEDYEGKIKQALEASPVTEVLVEQSIAGWKEYEMEVMRDRNDNAIIVCCIENIDPMGVHTGDSITVCPAMTLTDKEYQKMRDASIKVLRKIGVETGGSNVQFAVNPHDGEMVVIEMNPRVSRSSALASKATGFPIAKIAAYLAVGFTLDELKNDITGDVIPASFEPSIDYVVTKIPRFTFEKFSGGANLLSTTMQSVGEVMAIARSFQESIQKALRSLEIGLNGFDEQTHLFTYDNVNSIKTELAKPRSDRLLLLAEALRCGISQQEIQKITKIDLWFIDAIAQIVEFEQKLRKYKLPKNQHDMRAVKKMGFSDARIAHLTSLEPETVTQHRLSLNVRPLYRRIDSCAAEFPALTAYMYSSYETPGKKIQNQPDDISDDIEACEAKPTDNKKIVILGGGPNRIGQGIEFDYCCCHAAFALKEKGFETIMINCNPETVSTDYTTADRLYFEPLSDEDVIGIIQNESKKGVMLGVIIQFGGQTPLKLAAALTKANIPVLGTSAASIELAEDRDCFRKLLKQNGFKQPKNAIATNVAEAKRLCADIGYPIVIRPSFVLGGRAMEIIYSPAQIEQYMTKAVSVSNKAPVLLDKYLENAIEIDVDALYDGRDIYICGIMEHIEEAGIHSGDSACTLPPISLGKEIIEKIKLQTEKLAQLLKVKGLMNLQFAIQKGEIYVLEVNPRASRTVPFVAKATGLPIARYAALIMAGESLKNLNLPSKKMKHICVKESVFPFKTFPHVDTALGPEMRSTGEVMGVDKHFPIAFAKSQMAIGIKLPTTGEVFISVHDEAKKQIIEPAKTLQSLGFTFTATKGTAQALMKNNVECRTINKFYQGSPHCVEEIYQKKFCLVLNTPGSLTERNQSTSIRQAAQITATPCYTTVGGVIAIVKALEALAKEQWDVHLLQEYCK